MRWGALEVTGVVPVTSAAALNCRRSLPLSTLKCSPLRSSRFHSPRDAYLSGAPARPAQVGVPTPDVGAGCREPRHPAAASTPPRSGACRPSPRGFGAPAGDCAEEDVQLPRRSRHRGARWRARTSSPTHTEDQAAKRSRFPARGSRHPGADVGGYLSGARWRLLVGPWDQGGRGGRHHDALLPHAHRKDTEEHAGMNPGLGEHHEVVHVCTNRGCPGSCLEFPQFGSLQHAEVLPIANLPCPWGERAEVGRLPGRWGEDGRHGPAPDRHGPGRCGRRQPAPLR